MGRRLSALKPADSPDVRSEPGGGLPLESLVPADLTECNDIALKHLRLGASLYVPATRDDLVAIGNGQRYPHLRSAIFCTEDAIRADEVETAVQHLESMLPQLHPTSTLRFIRVRNPEIMARLLALPGIQNIDGFVLPKTTRYNIRSYLELLSPDDHVLLMPTLETAEAFDQQEMRELRTILMEDGVRERILALRVGANDMLSAIGVRRSIRRTIYDTAVGATIAMLVGVFRPYGFNLTAPVFEGLAQPEVLGDEVERDLMHGLFGKTAVHPDQIQHIESAFRARAEDLEMAHEMLRADAPAVFRMHDTMCEPATHTAWARLVIARAAIYGVIPAASAHPFGAVRPTWTQARSRHTLDTPIGANGHAETVPVVDGVRS